MSWALHGLLPTSAAPAALPLVLPKQPLVLSSYAVLWRFSRAAGSTALFSPALHDMALKSFEPLFVLLNVFFSPIGWF